MKTRVTLTLAFALVSNLHAMMPPMSAAPDRTNGVYQVNDTVHWKIDWKGASNPPAAHYVLKSGGYKVVERGDVLFTNNTASLVSMFDQPNTLLLEVDWSPEGISNRIWSGAVAAPEKIKPAAPVPDDFAGFWDAKLKKLNGIPPNPELERVEMGRTNIAYWKITMSNIWETHIQGQLARPAAGEKFPGLLILQYAGVYALQKSWVTDRANEGWLALNIEAHDIPIDKPADFYTQLYAGALKNYWNIGNDDRDKSYYLRMYLGCVQALKYLRSRPDWDGKTIVVMGGSQGGQQTLALAGLCPDDITAIMTLVPAACDMLAPAVDRACGFPNWYFNTSGKDKDKVHETSRYFDPVNFASRIKCPALIALGLHDEELAPPSSILAAVNSMTSPKEVIILPNSGHQNENGSQEPYNQRLYRVWLPALRQGRPLPQMRPMY
ncbi:MAG TPA: acetylxylan esterase [Verrucomicrobiae bacterium]|jgi:cephalosporin-C deacetylase-like acetyl esterase|nr:acetylxylan esterase [Verrucomicrobiae bacterium]